MYECFHCGERAVVWDGDFSFEDYCEEGEGIVHECHCANCGATITYKVSTQDKEEVCPFCKKPVETKEFWKYGTWSRGCFNPDCKIKPKTVCKYSKEEAEKEWEEAYGNYL